MNFEANIEPSPRYFNDLSPFAAYIDAPNALFHSEGAALPMNWEGQKQVQQQKNEDSILDECDLERISEKVFRHQPEWLCGTSLH